MKKTELDKLRKNYYKNGWILHENFYKRSQRLNDKIDSFKKNYQKYSGKTLILPVKIKNLKILKI